MASEATAGALDYRTAQLERGQRTLLLSHTNAAREEVRQRFAYVGLSRAQQQLHLLAPSQGASELFSC
jgi:hypothetical protein